MPKFAKDQDMMNVSPADVAEAKKRALNEAAYNAANRTAPAPAAPVAVPRPARSAAIEEAITEAEDAKARKKIAGMGYKKGGSVSSASRRADGIATKGKTKGRFV